MANTITITPQQCKRARALLKWNPQDLASHTRISVRIIEKFERNQMKLLRPDNEEIVETFHNKGIQFSTGGDVTMKGTKNAGEQSAVYEDSLIDATDALAAALQQPDITDKAVADSALKRAPKPLSSN